MKSGTRLATGLIAFALVGLSVGSSGANTTPTVEAQTERSTVRVVVYFYDDHGNSMPGFTGTGIVVGLNSIVTNLHVVEPPPGATSGKVYVVPDPRSGENALAAEFVDQSTDFDLALLSVTKLAAKPITLSLDRDIKGTTVRALGYPGGVDRLADQTRRKLLSPSEPYVTEGNVALLTMSSKIGGARVPVVFHTAPISTGSSGGPLADECGRLVGVNTMGAKTTVDDDGINSPSGQFVATRADDLLAFLKRNNIAATTDARRCDHGRLVAAADSEPGTRRGEGSSWLTTFKPINQALANFLRDNLLEAVAAVSILVMIYLIFARARAARRPAPVCLVPASPDTPQTPTTPNKPRRNRLAVTLVGSLVLVAAATVGLRAWLETIPQFRSGVVGETTPRRPGAISLEVEPRVIAVSSGVRAHAHPLFPNPTSDHGRGPALSDEGDFRPAACAVASRCP